MKRRSLFKLLGLLPFINPEKLVDEKVEFWEHYTTINNYPPALDNTKYKILYDPCSSESYSFITFNIGFGEPNIVEYKLK